jgi:hypothetical protein
MSSNKTITSGDYNSFHCFKDNPGIFIYIPFYRVDKSNLIKGINLTQYHVTMPEYSCLMQSNNKKDNDNSTENLNHKIVFVVWDREGIRATGISKTYRSFSLFFVHI